MLNAKQCVSNVLICSYKSYIFVLVCFSSVVDNRMLLNLFCNTVGFVYVSVSIINLHKYYK